MAQKTVIELTDDLDGKPAEVTRQFGVDGVDYEIDLTLENSAALDEALDQFIVAGRRVKRDGSVFKTKRTQLRSDAGNRQQSKAIRAWAAEQGIAVSDRGRLPAEIVEKYEAAHATSATRHGVTAQAAGDLPAEETATPSVNAPVFAEA